MFDQKPVKILAFAGSARKDSFNKKLVKIAARGASTAGATVIFADLKDYPMPIFDQDLEQEDGMPDSAKKFKQLMAQNDGFLIAAPEYNSGITPLLKNVIDWCSRAESKDEPPLSAFRGKSVGLMSASPGGLGGLRGLMMTRDIFANIGVLVLPEQRAVPKVGELFDEQGELTDEKQAVAIEQIGAKLVGMIASLKK